MYKTFAKIPQEIDILFFLFLKQGLALALPNRLGWQIPYIYPFLPPNDWFSYWHVWLCALQSWISSTWLWLPNHSVNPSGVFSTAQGAMSSSPAQVLSQTCGWMKSQASVHQLTSLDPTWGQARIPSEKGMPLQLLQTPSVRCWSRGVAIPLTIPAPTPQLPG